MKLHLLLALPSVIDGLEFPVGITNCGIQSWIQSPPKRAVTMNQATTEIMLALGLADHMVGTAGMDDSIWVEYEADYKNIPVLAQKYPDIDTLLSVEPDFVVSYH
jgi:iron complex transport system substrate-binding protein